jgi:alanine dehydrogenase
MALGSPGTTLLLSRQDVAALVSQDDCISVVEQAFRLYGEGQTAEPAVLGVHVAGGGFHVKAAALDLSSHYFAAKLNANFPGNRAQGLPTIQGVITLFNAVTGELLALMDSIEITVLRTAGATATAARYLALPEARSMTVIGCGNQGYASIRAISRVRRIDSVFVWDIDASRAAQLARDVGGELTLSVQAVDDWHQAAQKSDIIVTCTPSTRAFLGTGDVRPGAFVAAVGADNGEKQEIQPMLMASAAVVADITPQSAAIGDLRHAIDAGMMSVEDVRADLGSVIAGRAPGRVSEHEVIIFDSTGTALQDVATAALAYERAVANGLGLAVRLA